MSFEDFYQIGSIKKTHGLKGMLSFELDVDFPSDYTELESIFLEMNGELIPFFLSSIQVKDTSSLLALEDVEDVDSAKDYVGCRIWLPLKFLPTLEEDQYYYHELVGFQFYEQSKLVGTVKDVLDLSSQVILSIDHNGTEVLIPLQDEIVLKVDKKAMKIEGELPEGLLQVYLES